MSSPDTGPVETTRPLRIAVIGGGISGLVCAWLLRDSHDVVVFEAADYIGGHTNTVRVDEADETNHVDTGFIVYNERTYPNFVKLLDRIGAETQPSSMSFSVHCESTGLEWSGSNLNTLFAQRRNLLRPRFWRMLREIVRFNRESRELIDAPNEETLGGYAKRRGYSREFVDHYLVPMGSAIWSTGPGEMLSFPAGFFVRFFANHGMLSVNDHPQWRVIRGGSERYVERLTAPFRSKIRLRTPVEFVRRTESGVTVGSAGGSRERFDRVIFATHSDQTLRMLSDPSREESEILGAMPYVRNETCLHTDERVMPRRRRAWASWNYRIPRGARAGERPVEMTYHMNRLQSLDSRRNYCVSLNSRVEGRRVLGVWDYQHPLYTVPGTRARARHGEINGRRNTYYCGAYWGNGFHEDGVNSALEVCRSFGQGL